MLTFIAKRYAKAQYRFRQLVEAETNELHAKLADKLAKEKRDRAAQITKEADQMDARIKEVEELENKGYWLCEDGHEKPKCTLALCDEHEGAQCKDCKAEAAGKPVTCEECKKPMKLIKRDQMTGQEKYESDKERGEAQDIAKQKREQAAQEEQSAQESEKAAKYFRGIAQNNRSVAEKLRRT